MEYGINRNSSGYYDETAYKAIKNYLKSGDTGMELYKGDIIEFEQNNGYSKEAVILSVHDRYSTILPLSDNEKLPYSVKCKGIKYTDTGMIQYVFNDKVTSLIRSMTTPEFDDLINAVVDGLGYEAPVKEVVKEVASAPVEFVRQGQFMVPETEALNADLTKALAERDVYKSLYENLISSMIAK